MDKTTKRILIIFGTALLFGLLILALILGWFYRRDQAFNSRPLVLIHSPTNNYRMKTGEMIVVHATAREDRGLQRIEFWADDQLVKAVEPEEEKPINLVLSSGWVPEASGRHQLVVRAYSSDQVSGQAAVDVFAEPADQESPVLHQVEEGETLESIGGMYGLSPVELSAANPDLSDNGPEPGAELVIPDTGPDGPPPAPLPEDAGEPPEPEGDPPLRAVPGIFGVFQRFASSTERIPLKLEITELRTGSFYDGLHCYLSLADSLPQWYPDRDHDQSTDESFIPLDGGWWETEPDLEGDHAPLISWPGDQDLPVSISCVGISGGAEAVNLGSRDLAIPPEEWDGTARELTLEGGADDLYLAYRISRQDQTPSGVPLYLDPDMTPPTNVHLNDRRRSLEWDYFPEEDEEPIDGFRIYLNGNLQWVEPPDARESGIPYEWFNPPCDSTYNFSVTAFRIGFPDGPESYPGIALIEQRLEDCRREIQIAFLSLETFDLGGDGRYEDRHGDIGPVYGYFYANEKQITFDAGHEGRGLDMPNGLRHNTTYDLADMSADPTWHFSGMNGTIVEVPPGGSFEFGYHLMDRDTGRCRDSDDRGCNDLICEGFSFRVNDTSTGALDYVHEGTLMSENRRCQVSYRWQPALDSPVGTGGENQEPLPWLELRDFYVSERTGEVELTLRNTGSATWPWRDLDIELQTREGESLGVYTWPEFVLETGRTTTLTHPEMVLGPPYDACVVIDPDDEVLEGPERTSAMFHSPVCPRLPDLVITDVMYRSEAGGQLNVTVQNNGSGPVDNKGLRVTTSLPDGTPLGLDYNYPSITLAPGESHVFILPEAEAVRDAMAAGYRVTVNPPDTFLEEDHSNNHYDVSEAAELRLYWQTIEAPYVVRNTVEFDLDAYILSGPERVKVADFSINQDINWGSCFEDSYCIRIYHREYEYDTNWFEIYGDQKLEIVLTVSHPGTLRDDYPLREVFTPPTWGAGPPFNLGCSTIGALGDAAHNWYFGYLAGDPWRTQFNLCVQPLEE